MLALRQTLDMILDTLRQRYFEVPVLSPTLLGHMNLADTYIDFYENFRFPFLLNTSVIGDYGLVG